VVPGGAVKVIVVVRVVLPIATVTVATPAVGDVSAAEARPLAVRAVVVGELLSWNVPRDVLNVTSVLSAMAAPFWTAATVIETGIVAGTSWLEALTVNVAAPELVLLEVIRGVVPTRFESSQPAARMDPASRAALNRMRVLIFSPLSVLQQHFNAIRMPRAKTA
jgi:hypothetical protein